LKIKFFLRIPACGAANYVDKLLITNMTTRHIVKGTSPNFKIQIIWPWKLFTAINNVNKVKNIASIL